MSVVVYDNLKITPNRLIKYPVYDGFKRIHNTKNLCHTKDKYKGELSRKAKTRLKDACNWMDLLCNEWKEINVNGKKVNFRLTFITLTLQSEQVHDDRVIKKKLLNQFLTELRQKHGLKTYVWKLERQKNNSVHFHLAADIGIHYNILVNIWNRISDKLGYVQRYYEYWNKRSFEDYYQVRKKQKKKREYWEILRDWKLLKLKKLQPNSTDIHSVKTVKDMAAYMAKYMTKESTGEKLEGRPWFISRNLSTVMKNNTVQMAFNDNVEFNELKNRLRNESIKTKSGIVLDRVKESDYFQIIMCSVKEYSRYGLKEIQNRFDEIVKIFQECRKGVSADIALYKNYVQNGIIQPKVISGYLDIEKYNYKQLEIWST